MRRRVMRFFGRSMFLGIGGLVSSVPILALDAHSHIDMTISLAWAAVCAVWTVLGVLGRTFAWR